MEGSRYRFCVVKNGSLWSSIATLRNDAHPEKVLILIGMIHIADGYYFGRTARIVDHLCRGGYKLFVEQVDVEESETDNAEVKQGKKAIASMLEVRYRLVDLLDQFDVMGQGRMNEHLRQLVPTQIVADATHWLVPQLHSETQTDIFERDAAAIGQKSEKEMAYEWLSWQRRMPETVEDSLNLPIVTFRNEIAVSSLRASTESAVLVYGAGHLPGIVELLESDGWRVTSLKYFEAIDLQRLEEKFAEHFGKEAP